jgi:hypothetical protein
MNHPGKILLLGSGETSPSGGRVFEKLLQTLAPAPVISILETPAGFELNSRKVAERVGTYLETRLQNYSPRIEIVPARKKGGEFSPDNPAVLGPLLESDVIYMGAGSPTYAVRQLKDSLAWEMVRAKHQRGTAVVLASAATIAAGSPAVPVYEIFKVGQDPFWSEGLDLLAPYGLRLAFVPHWNNQEGGADLDTSRCFLGLERFAPLQSQLPAGVKIVGLDEMTALWVDLELTVCEVHGLGCVHILDGKEKQEFASGMNFPLSRLGDYLPVLDNLPGISAETWSAVDASERAKSTPAPARFAPDEVVELVNQRQSARQARDWQRADDVRRQIEAAGWQVNDTPGGPVLEFVD